ncbi:MAG: carboxypeptidase M32 [Ktedonobacterales bacterium]|nr:carboxypeptidase M32 [Ktedonobacterales bacterium]
MDTTEHDARTAPAFTEEDARISELLALLRPLADLRAVNALAEWDQNTALPDGAAEVRGAQLATLQGVMHDRWTAPQLGTLLEELGTVVDQPKYRDADRGLVRQTRRAYDHATKLPRGLVEEMARVGAGSFEAWRKAKSQNDFALFAPWLARTVTLQREVADRLGYAETRYDALLDLYEPGMTATKLDALFAPVRETATALLRRIQTEGQPVDASCLEGEFPVPGQMELSESLLRFMGYDFERGQLAQSPHPFTVEFGSPYDVRVTVHPDKRFIQAALMAALHEGGHALYEQGSAPALTRTPVAGGASMGAHESQSRLWENAIGRSQAFWHTRFAHVAEAYPRQLAGVDAETFTRALNRVRPSLIRIEADEVTYNSHIIIRYEMEKAIVNGNAAIESLPGLWNAKYRDYLGIEPESDSEGILQDIHWTGGFGYFPTYTLGNLYAAQIYATLRKEFPDFDQRLAGGDTSFVLRWLRERMYVFGAIYLPEALIQRVTGERPQPEYFTRYLTAKVEETYRLPATSHGHTHA